MNSTACELLVMAARNPFTLPLTWLNILLLAIALILWKMSNGQAGTPTRIEEIAF